MKKARFTESQIISILSQQEKGITVADICRENGISNATFFQSLSDVREKIQEWATDYNENRPHKALNYLTPKEVYDKRI